jgi:hypothetical protein
MRPSIPAPFDTRSTLFRATQDAGLKPRTVTIPPRVRIEVA